MIDYILHLADNALVLGHRNSEWTGHGPILEQDIALSNIALDLIGQARHLYQYAAAKMGDGTTEDSLAYLRDAAEFKNCLLAEQLNGHWGKTVLRQFLFSAYQYPLYQQLTTHEDDQLRAIAEKSLKEVTYHLRWSSEWVLRLGLGTDESRTKMQDALNDLWPYSDDLVHNESAELKAKWKSRVDDILHKATLHIPKGVQMIVGGMDGLHTPHLSTMLDEMQYMQRNYPGVEW